GKFFKPKDVIIAETGTSSIGIVDIPLPEKSIFVSQILWGSIGWTVGSTLGAARNLGLNLFIGDGSLQLTVQELSVMLRHGLKPIIFVLNNSGYTIEVRPTGANTIFSASYTARSANGRVARRRDGDSALSQSYTVKTKDELEALLATPLFAEAGKMQLVEMMMPKHDAPWSNRRS
ncbi:thiamine diphosphate-binding protein, partial [Mycena rosella]